MYRLRSAGWRLRLFSFIAVMSLVFVSLPRPHTDAVAQGSDCAALTTSYSESFDTLATSGTATMPPPASWRLSESGSAANTTYAAGDGGINTGNTYSFGTGTATDRALGSVASGSLTTRYGTCFTNAGTETITGLAISYTGEQWRTGGQRTTPDILDFAYSLDATTLETGAWVDFNTLDFQTPAANVTLPTGAALNGNVDPNRTAISGAVTGLSAAPGAVIWIRWSDSNAGGSDDGLAVDNLAVTAQTGGPTATPTNTLPPTNTPTNTPVVTNTPTNTPGPGTVRIRDIQGARHISPMVTTVGQPGQAVSNVPGIVTAKKSNGFYLQDPSPDANDATSEGIFVFTSSAPTVNVGDSVLVSGAVTEFRPGGSGGTNNLTLTEITGASITLVASGQPLPAPVVLGAGGRAIPATVIDNDAVNNTVEDPATPFDPVQDGIDFYESLEAMRVQVNNAVAVSRRTDFGTTNITSELWVLADNGVNATGRSARGGVIVSAGDFNPERIQIDSFLFGVLPPAIDVGDTFPGAIVGVIDFNFGNFELLNTQALPARVPGGLTREITNLSEPINAPSNKLTVGTFNVENLDPGDTTFNALAARIVTNLKSPDILNIEEIQDNNGPTNDAVVAADVTIGMLISAIQAAGGPTYQFKQINPVDDQDGGEPGGNIRVAFLYNPARVTFVERNPGGSTTSTSVQNVGGVPQLTNSPGRIQPTSAAFNSSRKPLAGEFLFNGRTIFVVNNHFNSKGGDFPLFGRFQPPTLTSEAQRLQQAQIVADFVDSILDINPNAYVVVAGDLNDFEFSPPLAILQAAGLTSLVSTLPANQRYSYVFEGNSQTLDHIMVSASLLAAKDGPDGFDVVHINAEFTDQDSDHDPSVARFVLPAVPTATPTNTPTNTPVPPTNTPTPTNTPIVTNTPTPTPTPVVAGAIELRLLHGVQANRSARYDPPGTQGLLTQTFNGEPGCGRFGSQPSLLHASGTRANGQPAEICMLNLRMGVEKGPLAGPLDNFRVNQGERLSFALGTDPSVTGKQIRALVKVKVEGNRFSVIRVTAYNGTTPVGTPTVVPLNSLTPQGGGLQANNYTINADFGPGVTRVDIEATSGSFSVVGGVNNSGDTRFALVTP